MKTVYLCGPISGLSWHDTMWWREHASAELEKAGIKALSPLRRKDFLEDEKSIKNSYNHPFGTADFIVTRDRFDVKNCDVVLANLLDAKTVSIGSMIEFGWASAYDKPIVAVMKKGDIHRHAIADKCCSIIVGGIDEAIMVTKAMLERYS